MLEEIMDDEEEVQQINLSSRPLREEQRKQRDRQRLEREMERQVLTSCPGTPQSDITVIIMYIVLLLHLL